MKSHADQAAHQTALAQHLQNPHPPHHIPAAACTPQSGHKERTVGPGAALSAHLVPSTPSADEQPAGRTQIYEAPTDRTLGRLLGDQGFTLNFSKLESDWEVEPAVMPDSMLA